MHAPARRRLTIGVPILVAAGLIAVMPVGAQETSSEAGGVTGAQIRAAIGQAGANDDQSGLTFNLGVAVEMDDGGEFVDGAKLAVAQIKAAGGPDIHLVDVGIGAPGAWTGDKAVEALRAAGVSVVLTTQGAAGGSMLEGLAADRILGLDGDVGVVPDARAKPYFWGLRSSQPDDDFPIGLGYWTATSPQIHRVSLVYSDAGSGIADLVSSFRAALADDGLQLASSSAIGAGVDLDVAIAAIRRERPDAIYVVADDPAPFLHQLATVDIDKPVMGTTLAADETRSSPIHGIYTFATDWFDSSQPANDWASLFVRSFRLRFGTLPQTRAANAYEDTFAVWTLIRRVLARGGDIQSGERIQQELVANPSFKSIYGGDGNALDDILLDPLSHSVIERHFGVFRQDGLHLTALASSDIGGANLELMKP